MRVTYGCLALILMASFRLSAQTFCVPDSQFTYPPLEIAMGIGATFSVKFDIVGFTAKNVELHPVDTTNAWALGGFNSAITENLNRLIYLKDTMGYQMTMKFIVRPLGELNHPYATRKNPEELDIVAPLKHLDMIIDYIYIPNPNLKADTIETTVPYKSGLAQPSNILVERSFGLFGPAVRIILNNYPNLTDDIVAIARKYDKGEFLIRAPNATRFFIRFRVKRELPQCNCTQTF